MRRSIIPAMRPLTPVLAGVVALSLVGSAAFAEARSYNLTGFDRIAASAGVTVILQQGPFSIRAEEPGGQFDRLKIELHGSTLIVSRTADFGWGWLRPNRHYTVTITAPAYAGVDASSGSKVSGQINAQDLHVNASSGADLRLSGSCASLTGNASSGADLDSAGLRCRTASLTVSSGANLRAWANGTASGHASSGADIVVHGLPNLVDRHQSSGGSVRLAPA